MQVDHHDERVDCTFCGGEGWSECDDPIQCTRRHEGDFCECSACDGRGYDQTVW